MKWSDTPMYQRGKLSKDDPMGIYTPYRNAESPSPTMIWHKEETAKQEQRLENEIDINEIKAALMGVKNKWTERTKKYPEAFVMIGSKFDWEKIKKLL